MTAAQKSRHRRDRARARRALARRGARAGRLRPRRSGRARRRSTTSTCTGRSSLLESGCPAETRAPQSSSSPRRPTDGQRSGGDDARARVDPLAAQRHRQRRAAAHPPVRADAARRDPRLRLADDASLEARGRRPRSRHPRRGVGRRLRRRRRARLPRHHLVERGADAEVEGRLRGLAGRARRLGRDPARHARRLWSSCAARASASRRSWTRPRRACCSRRGSAGSATGGTRSSSASRRAALGAEDRRRPPARCSTSSTPTFHPTFLYELIWDVVGRRCSCSGSARRWRIRPPGLFALYVAYYCFGRFFEELLRVDPAHHFAGLRLNAWVSVVCLRRSPSSSSSGGRAGPAASRGAALRRRRSRAEPPGPKMAVPRGRVR